MMRTAFLLLCLSFAGLCYAATYQQAPEKPILLIVHANWCMPCRNLDEVYLIDAEFRGALERAFDVRHLDWQIPSHRKTAESLGVTELPSLVVMRNGRKVAMHTGFSCDMQQRNVDRAIEDLMNSLHVEWPPPKEKPISKPASQERPKADARPSQSPPPANVAGPMIDEGARSGIARLASETKQLRESHAKTEQLLQDLHGLQAKLDSRIETQGSDIRSMSSEIRQTIEQTIAERLKQAAAGVAAPPKSISNEIQSGGTGSKWLNVVSTAAKIGLSIAAPEIAIPGAAALTVAGYGLSILRRRRVAAAPTIAMQPTKIVPIAVDAPPSPQVVNTETHFVPVERDTYQQAHAWAKEQLGRRYPGAVATIETLDGLISQYLSGRKD